MEGIIASGHWFAFGFFPILGVSVLLIAGYIERGDLIDQKERKRSFRGLR